MRIQVHELHPYFFKSSLRQQVPFHARQGLVRVVVRLFDESQLLPLVLVQARIDAVVLLESLKSQYE